MPPPHTSFAPKAVAAPPRLARSVCDAPEAASGTLLREQWAGYDALMLGFSLLAIGMLVVGVAVELGPSSQ